MKVKLQTGVYISTPTEYSTCVSCVFLSDNGGICKAPNFIYHSCIDCHQVYHHSQKFSQIFNV